MRGEKAQALMLLALIMPVLLGFTALAVDASNAYAKRRKMQNAADASAFAGVRAYATGADVQAVQAAIYKYAEFNGVGASDTAWSYIDEEAEHVGVMVTTTTTFTGFFSTFMGMSNFSVSAMASAELGQRRGTVAAGIWVGDGIHVLGEGHTIIGDLHSDGDLSLGGQELTISGTISYAGSCSGDLCSEAEQVPLDPMPGLYDLADYQPGGNMAIAAGTDYHYTEGNLLFPCDNPQGLYYATGHVTVDCEMLSASVSIVAEGKITIGGENTTLSPYSDGLLLFSNETGEAIKLAGDYLDLSGVIYAPLGQVKIQALDLTVTGSIIGERAHFTGGSEGATIIFQNYLPNVPFLSQ